MPGIIKCSKAKDLLQSNIENKEGRTLDIDEGLTLYKPHLAMKGKDGKAIPTPKSRPGCGATNPFISCWKLKDKFVNKKSGYYWL